MASSSKSKLSVSEVNSARNKLSGVLQTLKQKVEDSTSTSDSSEDGTYSFPSHSKKEMAGQNKRGGKSPRKRRRKDESGSKEGLCQSLKAITQELEIYNQLAINQLPAVLPATKYRKKNFGVINHIVADEPSRPSWTKIGRVDLAKFSVSSPLYPICRAWMTNEPNVGSSPTKSDPEVVNIEEEAQNENPDEEQCITVLPSPLKIPKVEDYYYQDLRIPSPMPLPEKLDNKFQNPDEPPSKDVLLSNHLLRWKEVRQKWRDASFMNEERYRDSIGIIKSLKVVFE